MRDGPEIGIAERQRQAAMTRRWTIILAILGLLIVVGAGIVLWRHEKPLPIPQPALEDTDAEYRASVEQAQQAIRASPKSAAAWAKMGSVFRSGGYRQPAAQCFAEAAQLEPANPRWPYLQGEALLWSDPQAAIANLRQSVARSARAHVEEPALHLRLAEELLASGQLDDAEEQLQIVLGAEPGCVVAHLLWGRVQYARNDLTRSREQWLLCLDSPFTRQQANNHLAELSRRLGDGPAAEKYQEKANALPADISWPDPWLQDCLREGTGIAALFRRAEQLESQGQFVEAVRVLREILREEPNYKAYVGLGKCLPSLGDLPGADRALRQALEIDPKGLQARYYLCRVLWAQAEQKRKAGAETEAVKLLEESVEQARLTIAQKPDYGLAHLSLGVALKQLHRNGEAAIELREAIAIVPDLPDPYLHLAELLSAEGKTAEARRLLEQALPLTKPDDMRVRDALAKLGQQTN
jgi:tetratricopeptide (TPR) repeat protein